MLDDRMFPPLEEAALRLEKAGPELGDLFDNVRLVRRRLENVGMSRAEAYSAVLGCVGAALADA